MKRILLFFTVFFGLMSFSFAQQETETFYKDKFLTKEIAQKKAKYKKVETAEANEIVTIKIYSLENNCLLRLESYKKKQPIGIWISNSDDCSLYRKRDFTQFYRHSLNTDTIFYNGRDNADSLHCEAAQYRDGEKAMMQYIAHNIRHPKEAIEQKISGKVYVSFIVKSDGSIDQISIVRGVIPYLDYAACEVVKNMPKWKPATKEGQPIDSYFVLPIKFMY